MSSDLFAVYEGGITEEEGGGEEDVEDTEGLRFFSFSAGEAGVAGLEGVVEEVGGGGEEEEEEEEEETSDSCRLSSLAPSSSCEGGRGRR